MSRSGTAAGGYRDNNKLDRTRLDDRAGPLETLRAMERAKSRRQDCGRVLRDTPRAGKVHYVSVLAWDALQRAVYERQGRSRSSTFFFRLKGGYRGVRLLNRVQILKSLLGRQPGERNHIACAGQSTHFRAGQPTACPPRSQ